MKSKYLFFCSCFLFIISHSVCAQQAPDSGFENWSGNFDGNAQLANWNGSNVTQVGLNFTFVFQENSGRTGKCVRIENQSVGAMGITENAPAYLSLGKPWSYLPSITEVKKATAGTDGGISFAYRPDSMSVWVKRSSNGQENMNLVFYSWKGNSTGTAYKSKDGGCTSVTHTNEESDIRQATDGNECTTSVHATQIAEGHFKTLGQYGTWTEIKVPITYYTNDVPEKMNIILSAGNYPNFRANSGIYAGNKLYVDDLRLIYSSKIQELYINNKKWSGFNPDKLEQTYALGVGVTTLPEIFAKRSGRNLSGSEITITKGTVGGNPTLITVKAEDGSSTTTYKIYFVAEQSTNSRPAGIVVGGTAIPGFNGYQTGYNVALPYGTTTVPEITITKAEEAQTYSITPCETLPGTAKVTVYAENTSFSTTYTINLSVAELSDNTLQDILIDGQPLPGFSPTKGNYTVELPLGTTTVPTITPVSAYPNGAQTIVATNNGLDGIYTITVSAPGNGAARTYKLTFKITASTYSYLKDLKIGGTTISDFSPEKLTYSYSLPIGTTVLPSITWTPGDNYQTVTKEEGGIDGTTKITVTAASGAVSIYRINFSTLKSTVATLQELSVGGSLISGFAPDKFNYTYELPIGTTTLPEITYVKGDEYQTVTLTLGGINGTTRIVVKAQNGNTNTYSIYFSVTQASVSTLLDIKIDGNSLEGFAPNILEYNYILPHGTTTLPLVTWTAHDAYQIIRKVDAGVNGDTKIIVKSQSGDISTYIIHFSVEISSNAFLKNIFINGEVLQGFENDKFTYTHILPIGTAAAPVVTWEAGDEYQVITSTAGGINGITQIIVRSEDGKNINTYTITFSVAQAGVSTLLDLQIDGKTIEGFHSNLFTYTYVLPRGTTSLPVITCTPNDAYQTIRIVENGVNGDTKIIVRAQTGAISTYTISFSVEKSTNSLLKMIFIGGDSISNFVDNILNYNITLPSGTTGLPEILWEKGDEYQTVFLNKGSINGLTTIRVVAENGTETIYNLQFAVEKSENAFLKNILIDNIPLAGFDKSVFEYTYQLSSGAISCPDIKVEHESGQHITISKPLLTGTAFIIVTPEIGNKNTYTIKFTFPQSTNNVLSDLKINGITIDGFQPDTKEYTYQLPIGTETLPEITYTKGDELQQIYLTKGNINGTSYICVVAEDGSQSIYTLSFNVQKSENAFLKNILIDGTALANFKDSLLNYTYELPKGTTVCPKIEVVKNNIRQNILISAPILSGDATITVIPEIGIENVYTITFAFKQSDNSQLTDIKIGGTSIAGFKTDSLEYTYLLPNGTTILPEITYTKGHDEQTVLILSNGVNGATTLSVRAENGSFSTYTVHFSVTQSDDATLKSIKLDGVEIDGFQSNKFLYTDTLTFGAQKAPDISVEGNHSAQQIIINAPVADGTATIDVIAENGNTQRYSIQFLFKLQTNTNLKNIIVDGSPLGSFDPNITNYVIDLPSGSAIPAIGCIELDTTQIILQTDEGINGTQILVTAENGDQKIYSIQYNILPNHSALLDDLQLYRGSEFVSIDHFDSNTFLYTDTLAWRSTAIPVIYPVAANKGQIITIAYHSVNDTTRIHVVAEDQVTTADYFIVFPVRKSAIATLSDISVEGGNLVPFFESDTCNYVVELPYGTTSVPHISWSWGEDEGKTLTEQSAQLIAGNLRDTTRLLVTAENGKQQTYNLTFKVAESTSDNTLTALIVEGIGNLLEGNTNTAFTLDLPYGTTTLPTITYSKNYSEQTVLVDNGGIYSATTITVKANKKDITDKIYTVTPNIAKLPTATLTDIQVNGTSVSGFSSDKFNYIVNVNAQPTITYTATTGITVEKNIENTKQTQFKVEDDAGNTNIYNVFVYYTNDVIPNGEFTNWTKAKYNNADKPTGWTVPADIVKESDTGWEWMMGTAKTGAEVLKNNTTTMGFKTTYWAVLAGSIPAVATIGSLSGSLKVSNGTTFTFGGGITYRNTPDFAKIRYYFKEKKGNGALFAFRFDDANRDYVTTSTTSDYVEYTHALTTSSLVPQKMNIAINASNSNGGMIGTNIPDELYVDYIRFAHSSKLNKLYCNGIELPSFNGGSITQTLEIDADFQGIPVLSVTGEVPDQAYDFHIGESEAVVGTYKIRTNAIDVTAEDGTKTNYTVLLRRALSSNKNLSGILIGETPIAGFASDTYEYNITVPNGTTTVPNITAIRSSMHQKISFANTLQQAIITVTAEDGTTQNYTIHFVEAKSDNTDLQNISIENNPTDFVFAADTKDYSVSLANGAVIPAVSYTKQSDGQTVILTTGTYTTIKVIAENGTDEAIYNIHFTYTVPETSGQLSNIAIDGLTLEDFAKDTYKYQYTTNNMVAPYFKRDVDTDTVTQIFTNDSILWTINGTTIRKYTLLFNRILSSNTDLSTILMNGDTLVGFNSTIYDYEINALDSIKISAICGQNGQTVLSNFIGSEDAAYLGEALFRVTAADTITSRMIKIKIRNVKSDNTKLAGIWLDDELIGTEAVHHIANQNFHADSLAYRITLPCSNPKVVEPKMPNIIIKAGEKKQKITLENNGLNADSYITVTAEDNFSQRFYDLRFNSAKSNNTNLTGISVNHIVMEDFAADKLNYEVQLNSNELPIINYTHDDQFQQIQPSITMDSALLKVIAEDNTEKTYVINFTRKLLSTNTTLAGIFINGVLLEEFSGSKYDYNVELPVGTKQLPTLDIQKGDDTQNIQLTSEGINGATNITVTAENAVQQIYTIHFNVAKSKNADLTGISVNYIPLSDFASDKLNYIDTLPNKMDIPTVHYTSTDPYQNISLQVNVDSAIISVMAQDSITQKVYVVKFATASSNNAYLSNILLDNIALTDFSATKYNYSIHFPAGTVSLPELSVIGGADGQTIEIQNKGLRDTTTITVTAEDGISTNIYRIDFSVDKSDVDTLKIIYLNVDSLANFNKDTLQYNIVLPVGTRKIPFISYEKGNAMQIIELDTISMEKYAAEMHLTVTAEKGNSRTYKLFFTVEKSTNDTLQDLTINGETIQRVGNGYTSDADFQPNILNYHLTWAVGTRTLPAFDWIAGDSLQTVTFGKTAENLDDSTLILVTAENGNVKTYTLYNELLHSEIDTLKMIFIDGIPLATFHADTLQYEIILPVGTRRMPTLSSLPGDNWQTTKTDTVSMEKYAAEMHLIVTAEKGNSRTYKLFFTVEKSTNDTLQDLTVNGETIQRAGNGYTSDADFQPNTLNYHLTWAVGTRTLPAFDWIAGDSLQTVTFGKTAENLNDSTLILVTAENGNVKTYTLYNTLLLSDVDTLKQILIDGIPLDNFHANVFTYTYMLPRGTQSLPHISWENGDVYQTVDTVSNGVNGNFIFTVTAENGTQKIYTISFSVAKSDNALLSNIWAAGIKLTGFDPEVFAYTIDVPFNTTAVPTITYEKADSTQTISEQHALTITDTTYITVMAENGTTQNIYKVSFNVLLCDNALLKNIFIGNEAISQTANGFISHQDFAPETFEYSIGLPFGTDNLPAITWESEMPDSIYKSISLVNNGIRGTSIITVVSQDEANTNEYRITFHVEKSSNKTLKDLKVNGQTIEGFNPDTLIYTIVYPTGTDSTELITPEQIEYTPGDSVQTITITQTEPSYILINVTAENEDVNVYVIHLEIEKSNNSLLKDILIGGTSLKNFVPDTLDYHFLLLNGMAIPEIEAIKSEEKQEISITMGVVGELTYIYCTAEDGSESLYTILFEYSDQNPGDEPTADDVCWSIIDNRIFKASTSRNNVKVAVFDTNGQLITIQSVPLADPNDEICESGATGAIFQFDYSNKALIYVFLYNEKKIITRGKFIY